MHYRESSRTSNTGRLLPLAVNHSRICIRGRMDRPTDSQGIIPEGHAGIVFYPSADSVELTRELVDRLGRPLVLVALDGNWNQASKMVKREKDIRDLPRVHLPPGPPSNFRLRTQSDPARVCTFEAVARALGIIEGQPVQDRLEEFFNVMVDRILWARGKLNKDEVRGGIPGERGTPE